MLIRRLLIAVCLLFIVATNTVGVFAFTTAPDDLNVDKTYGNLSNTSENTVVLSEVNEPNTYYIDVFGEKPICNDARYYKECISFTGYYKGEPHDISIWVDKYDADNAKLFFVEKNNKNLTQNNSDFISKNKEEISRNSENTAFKIVFKNNALNVNNISLISNLDRIDNINPINVSKVPAQTTIIPVVPNITETAMFEGTSNEYIHTDMSTDEYLSPVDSGEKNTGDSSKKTIIAIIVAALVVVVIIAVVVPLVILKRRDSSQPTRNPDKQDIPVSRSNQRNKPRSANQLRITDIPTQSPPKSTIDIPEIPTAVSTPIRQTYTADESFNNTTITPQRSQPQKQNPLQQANNHIIKMLFGREPADELPSNCVPVYITNTYELNVSDFEKPKFAAVANANSADYIVLDGKYLYINPLKYNGSNLKAYSSIKAISRCFLITNNGAEIQPLAQKINRFSPAVIEQNRNPMILIKQGIINVE